MRTHTRRFKGEKSQQSECETSVGVALKQQLLSVSIKRGLAPKDKRYDRGSELDSFIIRLHPCDSRAGGTEGGIEEKDARDLQQEGENLFD